MTTLKIKILLDLICTYLLFYLRISRKAITFIVATANRVVMNVAFADAILLRNKK